MIALNSLFSHSAPRPPLRVLNILDVFCGAGGGTDATREAAEMAGHGTRFTLVNHWDVACATAKANFPEARVLCTGVENLIAQHLYLRGRLDVLQGGPECIEFSRAAGKKPKNYQYRPTPWCMLRFAEALLPKIVLIENVAEFEKKWPPFKAFVAAFRALGYAIAWRVFNAADYGDPTTRERLFLLAVRRPLRLIWAEPTHSAAGGEGLAPWCDAEKHVIDWRIKGRWLDEMPGQKRYGGLPLSPKTIARIFAGLRLSGCEPVIAEWDDLSSKKPARSVKRHLSTIMGKARHGLAEPFFVVLRGTGKSRSIKKPIAALTAGGEHLALIEPFLVPSHSGKNRVRSVKRPLHTVCGNARGEGLVEAALLPQHGGGALRSVKRPAPTVSTDGAIALVEAFLVKYYGTGKAVSVKQPLPAVTTKDRFALCCPVVIKEGKVSRVRIRWRMLQPRELAAAQGFRKDYKFFGARRRNGKVLSIEEDANKGDIVKQIGNAWPHNLARALMLAALTQKSDIRTHLRAWDRRKV